VAEPDDADAFTAMYRQHYARVYAYAVSRAGRQLADEVVGETFLVAWRRRTAVPGEPLPWLLGVARNVVRERYRAEVRQQSIAAELRAWAGEQELQAADVADGVAHRAAVLAALSRLSEDDRELLTLLAWHGLSAGEAARVVGCTPATFAVRLHRARKRLERAMAPADDTPTSTDKKELTS
jgi:RNA polymerase sigma-70 factor, ECF subfamily